MNEDLNELPAFPEDFSGQVRLFPLPNLVMFPGVIQPLRVFESRYIEMFEDALATDRLIAMTLLEPGWEGEYESRPPVSSVVCIGRVLSENRDDQGCYNFLLAGQKRARIISELPPSRSFREARVELLVDSCDENSKLQQSTLKSQLVKCFCDVLRANNLSNDQINEFLSHDVPLGALTDVIAFSSPLDVADKQSLLAECNIEHRAMTLLRELRGESVVTDETMSRSEFPPPFSVN